MPHLLSNRVGCNASLNDFITKMGTTKQKYYHLPADVQLNMLSSCFSLDGGSKSIAI